MRVLVTGATGFIGQRVVPRLVDLGHDVTVLVRNEDVAGVKSVRGDLERSESYVDALSDIDAVVHLAALTGKAPAARHERVNFEAAAELFERCKVAGIKRFVFASTVAVAYPEKKSYPYARAKESAEKALLQSGLSAVILRPTLVLGPGSPIQEALSKLAGLPVTPLFGNGKTRVQPVHVDDVADAFVRALSEETWVGQTIGIGGPTVLSFDELMNAVRQNIGKNPGPLVHLPAGLVQGGLSLIEPILLPVLPLTAGQIYAFRYDSTVADSAFTPTRNINAMLDSSA